jgi:hypothetical protein
LCSASIFDFQDVPAATHRARDFQVAVFVVVFSESTTGQHLVWWLAGQISTSISLVASSGSLITADTKLLVPTPNTATVQWTVVCFTSLRTGSRTAVFPVISIY